MILLQHSRYIFPVVRATLNNQVQVELAQKGFRTIDFIFYYFLLKGQ